MSTESVLGIDIGGKNIKYTVLTPEKGKYHIDGGIIHSISMKMELDHILKRLLARIPEVSCIGVTMSFPVSYRDFQKGVEKIVNSFVNSEPGAPVLLVDFQGDLWSLRDAVTAEPVRFSASNFFGSAFLASKICDNAVMIDTGSTSTDIILIKNGRPLIMGKDIEDIKRNLTGEMTWTGIMHTLVSSLTHFVPFRGRLVRVNSSSTTTNDIYNVLNYAEMGSLLRIYGMKQKEIEYYYLSVASFFGYDLSTIEPREIENASRFVSIKHMESVAESLLRVISGYNMSLQDTNFVLMGIGKDILLKKVLNLLEVPKSRVFDVADYVPSDSWTYGSALGVALHVLDHVTGEHVAISEIKEVN